MKRTLLLDAGGTIVFPNFQRISDELAKEGLRVNAADLMRADIHARFELDRPEMVRASNNAQTWGQYFGRLFEKVGVARLPHAALERLKKHHDRHNLWDFMPEEMPAVLDTLKSRFHLGIVSNANGTVRALFSRLKLAGRFELILDSQEEGVEKPDPRIFQIALDRMGIAASETAYVGDLYHVDVLGARKAGLTPFLLDPLGLHADKSVARVKSLEEIAGLSW